MVIDDLEQQENSDYQPEVRKQRDSDYLHLDSKTVSIGFLFFKIFYKKNEKLEKLKELKW